MLGILGWLSNPETYHTGTDPWRWYHGQPKCVPSTESSLSNQQYLLHALANGRVWHKAFLRWVQVWHRYARHSQKFLGRRRHSPQKDRLRHQVINLGPPRRVRAWGGDHPQRLEECQSWPRNANAGLHRYPRQAASTDYCIQRRDTPDKIHAANTTAGRSVTHLLDPAYQIKRYLSAVTTTGRVWHEAFFKVYSGTLHTQKYLGHHRFP